MAKTYAQIQTQIHKLQQQADALKAKEVAGVVARIQQAINHYGLTPQDLFNKLPASPGTKPAGKRANPGSVGRADKAQRPAKPAKPAKPAAAAKYQDGAGHGWSGIGKRPNWFKAALAAGKTADELLVKPAA